MQFPDREVLLRTDAAGQDALAALIRTHEPALTIRRIEQWRAGELPLTEILVGLTSAGSLASIAAIAKEWIRAKRARLEIINEQTGKRLYFEGELSLETLEHLQRFLTDDPLDD